MILPAMSKIPKQPRLEIKLENFLAENKEKMVVVVVAWKGYNFSMSMRHLWKKGFSLQAYTHISSRSISNSTKKGYLDGSNVYVGGGKRIVFVVVLFRRFLINDGYFEKDQMKKLMLFWGPEDGKGWKLWIMEWVAKVFKLLKHTYV